MWSTRGRSMSTISRWALRLNKRLPTEAKWGKASRGTDSIVFPWGDEFPTNHRVTFCRKFNRLGFKALEKIDSMPDGRSPYGIHHMAGNVWKWVNDWYGDIYYEESPYANPKGPDSGTSKVLRGGNCTTRLITCEPRTALTINRMYSKIGRVFGALKTRTIN